MSDNQEQDAGDKDEFDPTSVLDRLLEPLHNALPLAIDTCDLRKINTASIGKIVPEDAVQLLLEEARRDPNNPNENCQELCEKLWHSVFYRLEGAAPNMNKPAEAYIAIFLCRHFIRIKGKRVIQYSYGNAPTQLLQSTGQNSDTGWNKGDLVAEFSTLKVFAEGKMRKLMDWYVKDCQYQLKIDITHTHVPVNTQDIQLMDPATRAQAMLTPVQQWVQKWNKSPSAADGTAICTLDGDRGHILPAFGTQLEAFLKSLDQSEAVASMSKELERVRKRDNGGLFRAYTMLVRKHLVFALGGGEEGASRYGELLHRHVSTLIPWCFDTLALQHFRFGLCLFSTILCTLSPAAGLTIILSTSPCFI